MIRKSRTPVVPKKRAARTPPVTTKRLAPIVAKPRTADKTVIAEAAHLTVAEERLAVGKRVVVTGRVRLRKRVHEKTAIVDENLACDEVDITRIAINRVVDGPVSVRHEGDVMVVPVVEERLVTIKQLVLVEEIRITRRNVERRMPQTVALRREEIITERLDPASGEWKSEEPGSN